MSRVSTGILAVFAASLALGGVQFVMASDDALAHSNATRHDGVHQDLLPQDARRDVASRVNRDAKGDREAFVPAKTASATLAFQLKGLSDTSIAMRLPLTDAMRLQPANPPVKAAKGIGAPKPMVACEPVVSPLTEVARQLGPGRCVT